MPTSHPPANICVETHLTLPAPQQNQPETIHSNPASPGQKPTRTAHGPPPARRNPPRRPETNTRRWVSAPSAAVAYFGTTDRSPAARNRLQPLPIFDWPSRRLAASFLANAPERHRTRPNSAELAGIRIWFMFCLWTVASVAFYLPSQPGC